MVASHGPGSNPRGNATCNAILLQCFRFYRSSVFNVLDHHCPPSSDVLPLNLARTKPRSKIQPSQQSAGDLRRTAAPPPIRGKRTAAHIAHHRAHHRASSSIERPASAQLFARVAANHRATFCTAVDRASMCAAVVITARQGRRIAARMLPNIAQPVRMRDGQRPASKWPYAQPLERDCARVIRAIALIPLLGNRGGSGSRLSARQRKNKIRPGNVQYNYDNNANYEPFIGRLGSYLADDLRLAPTGITRRPALHGITDSACKNQLVVVSVQYGPFNPYIPIRSTTIGKSRVAIDPIAMHTSWRSNSDIASVTSIGYPRMSASGESSTTMHRLLHASGSHPIPPPDDPKLRHLSCRVSMTFRVVRTNQYNQDLGLINSINGNHLECPNEGSSIDHQVTIYLHAQNITMFPTNETWYFASQILVSSSGGLILILTAQSTRN
ncbi:hypothetical protein F511_24046 [Dorcoceras hygrometricum]|uniref:Uncharacterized protein n=1 Tax=Dorcoceras hygrometricum TaxID=472368 RepID=A0A2Z7D147_9LAMI|nr:hypothetical protein F511_24046 [Dorcoceras hygrometricum]